MKLRKTIEVTVQPHWDKYANVPNSFLIDPSDFITLKRLRKAETFVSERIVYRLASYKLWNFTQDGPIF